MAILKFKCPECGGAVEAEVEVKVKASTAPHETGYPIASYPEVIGEAKPDIYQASGPITFASIPGDHPFGEREDFRRAEIVLVDEAGHLYDVRKLSVYTVFHPSVKGVEEEPDFMLMIFFDDRDEFKEAIQDSLGKREFTVRVIEVEESCEKRIKEQYEHCQILTYDARSSVIGVIALRRIHKCQLK